MKRHLGTIGLLLLVWALLPLIALAQGDSGEGGSGSMGGSTETGGELPFYRVYNYEVPFVGWAEPTLWTNYIAQSREEATHFGRTYNNQGLGAYSLEMEYGLKERFAVGAYLDALSPRHAGAHFAGGRLLARYRIDNKYEHFFDTGIYAEYYLPSSDYHGPQKLETRVILEHDFNDVRLDLNPIVTINTTSEERHQNPSLSDAIGIYYRRHFTLQPGLELYNDWGPIGKMPSLNRQQHILFPTLDIQFGRLYVWTVGAGYGLTSGSDRWTFKSIFRYEFDAVRPSRIFGRP